MTDCKTCEYENICEMPDFVRNNLKLCKTYTPKIKRTNSEKIRSMSDEGLAEFIDKVNRTCLVDALGGKSECNTECRICKIKFGSILEWLQSEAE